MTTSPIYAVPPVERAFKVLRHIANGDPITNVSATARVLKISRTTLIRLIATLEAEAMIEPKGDGYVLGLGLAGLAGRALVTNDIVKASDVELDRLVAELQLSAHVGVLRGRDVLYVARRAPNAHLVSNVSVGSHLPAHATTMGRIILAYADDSELAERFGKVTLKAVTAKTPTTLSQLQKMLAQDRADGVAWSDGNFETGIASAAVAILDPLGKPIGAINVTGPSAACRGDERQAVIASALRRSALNIAQRLGHQNRSRAADKTKELVP
jgi:DNA-binding IclR family transcriptional regulator